jgi:hypothetical protein
METSNDSLATSLAYLEAVEKRNKEKKEKEEKDRQEHYKQNFTAWIYDQLQFGKQSLITYLPFVPALVSAFFSYVKSNYWNFSHEQIFNGSIFIQVVFIFCILVYQVYQFSNRDKDGLEEKIRKLASKFKEAPPKPVGTNEHAVLYQFTHTNIIYRLEGTGKEAKIEIDPEQGDENTYWQNFRRDFKAANKNIKYFKISWIILWVNWFCFYIALLMQSHSTALFDFFMITETLSFAACYHWLTHHAYETRPNGRNLNWLAVVIASLLFALAIADQCTQDNFTVQMVLGVMKTLFSCVFLGLLVGILTIHVKNSPNWLKILLFCYVALQPILFGIFEMPSLTRNYFGRTLPKTESIRKEQDRISLDTLNARIDSKRIIYKAFEDTLQRPKRPDSVFVFHESIKVDSILQSKDKAGSVFVTGTFKVDTIKKAVHKKADLREIGNATEVINASVTITNTLGVILLNLCLALKYLLMFYFIWLLRYNHLLVYFIRTQGDHEYVRAFRKKFEDKIEELGKKETGSSGAS